MAQSKDYYKILGIDRNADEKEIKKAFRQLSLKYHPDRNPNNKEAEEKFKEIAEAYSVLSDKDKKAQYDTFGTVGDGGFNMDPHDIFASFFRNSDFFRNDDFGFGDEHMQRTFKGMDKNIKINVTLNEIYNNASKSVVYTVKRPCPNCNGTGSKTGKVEECPHCNGTGHIRSRKQFGVGMFSESITTCSHCGGTGKLVKDACSNCNGSGLIDCKENFNIKVPTIDKVLTQAYRHRGSGHSCQNGLGVNGDLNITFSIINEDGYEISNGLDIIKTVEVPLIDCLLGTSLKFVHLDGKTYSVNIKECSKDGALYKISGKGFRYNNQYRGDLYVKVKMVMPTKLDEEDKKILNNLKKSKTFKKNGI